MTLRRTILIVLAILIASSALFTGAYYIAFRCCTTHLARSTDDLEWLRREFTLSDTEMARIRRLHEGYLPVCQQWCDKIAEKRQALDAELKKSSQPNTVTENLLSEIASLRSRCQADMLRHFHEVSQAMPPEQGQRYLAEMRRLTLGFHEQLEESMSGHSTHHGQP